MLFEYGEDITEAILSGWGSRQGNSCLDCMLSTVIGDDECFGCGWFLRGEFFRSSNVLGDFLELRRDLERCHD